MKNSILLTGKWIVSDSKSDDSDDYIQLDIASERAKDLIARKRKSISRRAHYLKNKLVAGEISFAGELVLFYVEF